MKILNPKKLVNHGLANNHDIVANAIGYGTGIGILIGLGLAYYFGVF